MSTDRATSGPSRSIRAWGAAAFVLLLAGSLASCASDDGAGPSQPDREGRSEVATGTKHELFGANGRLAFGAPRLAHKISIERDGDGAKVRVRIAYDVAHEARAKGVAPDRADVTLRVARSMMSMGPQPNDLVFSSTQADEDLAGGGASRSYEFDLPGTARQFLESKGVTLDGDGAKGDALDLVDVSVQHHRDFQVVDGEYDWIHGATFTALSSPTQPSDKPGGSLTVRNDTAAGIYTYPSASLEPVPQEFGQSLYPDADEWSTVTSDSSGVDLALSGQSGSCFYQGTDGSNPDGFDVTLQPGEAVTQTIVANDQTDNLPFNNTEAAAMADATEVTLKAGVTALNLVSSLAFGGPFTLPIALATNVINTSQYCNNQPNLMQLGAVVAQTGEGSNSTMWSAYDDCDGTCGGFANVYSSPLRSDEPNIDVDLATQAVQLAPDSTYTYQGQPLWLAQAPITGCGVGDANNSNESGCTSQNLISLRWSQVMPCPYNNGIQPAQGNVIDNGSLCYQPTPTSPEVPSCGTNNAECLTYEPEG